MLVLRSTMEARISQERKEALEKLGDVSRRLSDGLVQCCALQKELSAWIMEKTDHLTPEQFGRLFWEQDGRWQAMFFNALQDIALTSFEAQPPKRPNEFRFPIGVPAGEGQWYHMCEHLDEKGWETIEVMFEHAKHWREKQRDQSRLASGDAAPHNGA